MTIAEPSAESPTGAAFPDRLPRIIQGGMGVGVSGWRLARAVARTGQLGVVSGVALDVMLARRLQQGDPGGELRRALAALPLPGVADRVLARYHVEGGIAPGTPYRPVPRLGLRPNRDRTELTVAANFAEVFLAREGHDGPVGVNYLEKIQMATPAATYGALLAGADYVLMGAGIPSEIPRLLDALAAHRPAEVSVTVAEAASSDRYATGLDPASLLAGTRLPALKRPRLLAIVSSDVLAAYLARRPETRPDGFVLEGPAAGGHSAPPRGRMRLGRAVNPCTGPGTVPTPPRSPRSVCRSGWPAATPVPAAWPGRCCAAPPASRSEPPSHCAANPAWTTPSGAPCCAAPPTAS
nr:hypothetical protein GCM10020093_007180 [Planobispora longispora]